MRSNVLRTIALIALAIGLALALAPSPVRADGPTIDPPSGTLGGVFQFTAPGFTPNEKVALWITIPGGTVLNQGYTAADETGTVNYTIVPSGDWAFGFYFQVAHGMRSAFESAIQFEYYSPARGASDEGSHGCPTGSLIAPGFAANEGVAMWYLAPDGTAKALPNVSADAQGVLNWTFVNATPGFVGTYNVAAQGYTSKFLASHVFYWDGSGFTGQGDCGGVVIAPDTSTTTTTGTGNGGTVLAVPRNVANFMGPGVYLNTDPDLLYYFDCNYKWRPMGGTIYFEVLGFQPYEQVKVWYEVLLGAGPTPYTTLNADENGNVAFSFNDAGYPKGHYHWWFEAKSAKYCGHYDP